MIADYLLRLKVTGRATAPFDPQITAWLLVGALFTDASSRDVMLERAAVPPERTIATYVDVVLRGIGVE
ncbi:hypothetical protein, partial [Enterococcus casseliflavus]|uniref:hypothetical protein n=1 Tax=Enterococcus casseliflavus TaxID=37734 RepID=UPI003D1155ED